MERLRTAAISRVMSSVLGHTQILTYAERDISDLFFTLNIVPATTRIAPIGVSITVFTWAIMRPFQPSEITIANEDDVAARAADFKIDTSDIDFGSG